MATDEFALGTFADKDGQTFAAIVLGDKVVSFDSLKNRVPDMPTDVFAALQDWDNSFAKLCEASAKAKNAEVPGLDRTELRPLPPVNLPRQIFGIGSNYRKFAIRFVYEEMEAQGLDPAEPGFEQEAVRRMEERAAKNEPKWFMKLASTIIGADDPLPLSTNLVHWECEIAAVIGKAARHVSAADASDYIAGYAIVNDVTDRTGVTQIAGRVEMDWMVSKSQPGFSPFGPLLVPAAFVNPYDLRIKLTVNGRVMQDDLANDMLVRIDRQIELLSKRFQLWPGDIICTGTPVGNGYYHNLYLKPGDEMIATIDQLGEQRTRCVAAAS